MARIAFNSTLLLSPDIFISLSPPLPFFLQESPLSFEVKASSSTCLGWRPPPPDFPTAICSTAAASPIFEASKHLATSFSLCASLHLNSQGVLESVHEIPVKSLSLESRQGAREFLDEVRLLLKVHQRNLVSLVSCCTSSPARAGHKIRATHTSQTLLATPTSSRTLRPRWTTGHELSKSTVNAGARIGCGTILEAKLKFKLIWIQCLIKFKSWKHDMSLNLNLFGFMKWSILLVNNAETCIACYHDHELLQKLLVLLN
ncbi:uncharacterized protein LOC124672521 [Lolium rigidum]|uniref:uncharacterized protein LOC124672521 n=1 Tax=Lolium rigidum TaxID=89674 RepID=UPI001F5C5A71|nr:uncharacterized protein LOC124672521 [Lolium rigidum]